MALPKLETASHVPPSPTRREKLKRFDADLEAYGPILGRFFEFTLLASLGALAIVAAVTALLFGVGFALYLLVQGTKTAISCLKDGAECAL